MESNYERLERELHEFIEIKDRRRLRRIQDGEHDSPIRQGKQMMQKLRELCRPDTKPLSIVE
jgi:hypothetical protein